MTDLRSAWKDAGEQLTTLGSTLKARYEQERTQASAQTKDEVDDAVKRLTGAVQEAFEAIGTAAKDATVRDDAKRAGQSVAGAFSATLAEIADDLRRVVDKGASGPSAQPEENAPPSESTRSLDGGSQQP